MRHRTMPRTLVTAVTGALVLAAAACGSDTGDTSEKNPKTLTIGIKYDQPGLGVRKDQGDPEGFDVDVATYVAKRLGVAEEDITWKEARSADRERQLAAGDVDFTVASYSITEERKKRVAFAGPYFIAGQDLLVRSGTKGIARPEDLGGRTLCSATGSTSAQRVRKDFTRDVRLKLKETYSACVDALLAGDVDAVTTDDVILAGFAARHEGELEVVGRPVSKEYYGIGLKSGDAKLQRAVTDAVRQMIDDGSWRASLRRHIAPSGYEPPDPPHVFVPPGAPAAGADAKADRELTNTARDLVALTNRQDYDALGARSCRAFRPHLGKIVAQLAPEFDTNLAAEVKGVRHHSELVGVSQESEERATSWARTVFSNVPDKYKRYFRDIDFTVDLRHEDGAWTMCGLAADFDEQQG